MAADGLVLSLDWIGRQPDTHSLMDWVPPIAVVWTAAIPLDLVYTWLRRPDEQRLIEELHAVYPAVEASGSRAPSE